MCQSPPVTSEVSGEELVLPTAGYMYSPPANVVEFPKCTWVVSPEPGVKSVISAPAGAGHSFPSAETVPVVPAAPAPPVPAVVPPVPAGVVPPVPPEFVDWLVQATSPHARSAVRRVFPTRILVFMKVFLSLARPQGQ